jgi:hypothetical protein
MLLFFACMLLFFVVSVCFYLASPVCLIPPHLAIPVCLISLRVLCCVKPREGGNLQMPRYNVANLLNYQTSNLSEVSVRR